MQQNYDAETVIRSPQYERPRFGWDAWLGVVGYIAEQHSPDALLRVSLSADAARSLKWNASVRWGPYRETVKNQPALGSALSELWHEVEDNHRIFWSHQDSVRRPIPYRADSWLDDRSAAALQSLINIGHRLFADDWQIVIVYQPSELSYARVQTRILAADYAVYRGGRGATLRESCQTLYHNAIDLFTAHIQRISEHIAYEGIQ
ncbi:MAG: hypothetical protein KC708_23820 [Anaerolineae bacterium]|nr:hypothetical protein [Anaerolineae bacterium]